MEWDKSDIDQEREKLRAEAELRRRQQSEGAKKPSKKPKTPKTPRILIRNGIIVICGIIPLLILTYVQSWDVYMSDLDFLFWIMSLILTFAGGIIQLVRGSYHKWKEKDMDNSVKDFTPS